MKKKQTYRRIAIALDRSVSTISDEINRNKVNGVYNADKAHVKSKVRRKASKYQAMKIVSNPQLREYVEKELLDSILRSPASISGRIKYREPDLVNVSSDSIRRFLKSPYGRQIEYKRSKMKKKIKYRKKNSKPRAKLGDRIFIDERPESINNREEAGDVEADFIVSGRDGKGICLTVVDRKLRFGMTRRLLPVTIANMELAFLDIQREFPEMKSVTTDNDLLFQKYKELETKLGVPVYFCHPYSSHEKGTVENYNREIRVYMPKGSDLSKYSLTYIQDSTNKANSRYLECLKFRTPQEALNEHRQNQKYQREKKKESSMDS